MYFLWKKYILDNYFPPFLEKNRVMGSAISIKKYSMAVELITLYMNESRCRDVS